MSRIFLHFVWLYVAVKYMKVIYTII